MGGEKMKAVILTKSAMYNKNCVACIDAETGEFKRLVKMTCEGTGPLDDMDMICINKTNDTLIECEPLEVVEVSEIEKMPSGHQVENVIIDTKKSMRYLGRMTIDDVIAKHSLKEGGLIFGSLDRKLSDAEINELKPLHSLELLLVRELRITKGSSGKPVACFRFGDDSYKGISVTDRAFYKFDDPEKLIGDAIVVASLAEKPYEIDGKYYKFIAQVFPRNHKES
jgi:hypothetical protein